VFAVGRYSGAVDLGAGALPDGGGTPTSWLGRFEEDGATAWSRTLARGRLDLLSLATAGDAAVVAGRFAGTLDIEGRVLTASGGADLLVAAFDHQGDLRWARAAGGEGTEEHVAIAAAGDRVFVSATLGRVSDPTSLQAAYRESDLLLVALDGDGTEAWRRVLGGADTAVSAAGVVALRDGGAIVAANFRGRLEAGGAVLESAGRDVLLLRFDRSGRVAWQRQLGTANDDAVLALAAGGDGVYLSGVFRGSMDLGGGAIESGLNSDGLHSQHGYLAQFGFNGEHLTSRVFGGPRSNRDQQLLVGTRGDLFASGRFLGLIDVGSGRLLSTQPFLDSFIARVEPGGGRG
jgi:hypothetical protein